MNRKKSFMGVEDNFIENVKHSGMQLKNIPYNKQNLQLVSTAIGQNYKAVQFASPKILKKYIKYFAQEFSRCIAYIQNSDLVTFEIVLQAVKEDAYLLENINFDTEIIIFQNSNKIYKFNQYQLCQIAEVMLRSNPMLISRMSSPPRNMIQIAIEINVNSIVCVDERFLDEELLTIVVTKEPHVITYIKNPSVNLQMLSVTASPWVFKFIKNPNKEVCKLAVQLNEFNCKHIPTEYADVIEYGKLLYV